MLKVGVTGATGFIGKRLCETLNYREHNVTALVRRVGSGCLNNQIAVVGNINGNTNWEGIIRNHNCIVHLAARVHIKNKVFAESWSECRFESVEGTLNLAKQAAVAGVKRFIYMSSIKVNGEITHGTPFRPKDNPAPNDYYGKSKFEAEKGLEQIANETGLEIVIIRAPLVYGPQVKANFLELLKWVHAGVPLPFGAVHNKRSLIYLDNLVDFIIKCITHPAAAGETFLISDGEDLSISDLICKAGFHMNRPVRLIPVPTCLLRMSGKILRKTAEFDKLCGSLQVDISKAEQLLNWRPPVSVDMGLKKTATWFVNNV